MNEGSFCDYVLDEFFIKSAGFGFAQTVLYFDSIEAQDLKAFSGDLRVGIRHSSNDSGDSPSNQSIGAWRRSTLMTTRFEIDVNGRSSRSISRFFKSDDFGMLEVFINMVAPTDDLAVFDNYGADQRIGAYPPAPLARQPKSLFHIVEII